MSLLLHYHQEGRLLEVLRHMEGLPPPQVIQFPLSKESADRLALLRAHGDADG